MKLLAPHFAFLLLLSISTKAAGEKPTSIYAQLMQINTSLDALAKKCKDPNYCSSIAKKIQILANNEQSKTNEAGTEIEQNSQKATVGDQKLLQSNCQQADQASAQVQTRLAKWQSGDAVRGIRLLQEEANNVRTEKIQNLDTYRQINEHLQKAQGALLGAANKNLAIAQSYKDQANHCGENVEALNSTSASDDSKAKNSSNGNGLGDVGKALGALKELPFGGGDKNSTGNDPLAALPPLTGIDNLPPLNTNDFSGQAPTISGANSGTAPPNNAGNLRAFGVDFSDNNAKSLEAGAIDPLANPSISPIPGAAIAPLHDTKSNPLLSGFPGNSSPESAMIATGGGSGANTSGLSSGNAVDPNNPAMGAIIANSASNTDFEGGSSLHGMNSGSGSAHFGGKFDILAPNDPSLELDALNPNIDLGITDKAGAETGRTLAFDKGNPALGSSKAASGKDKNGAFTHLTSSEGTPELFKQINRQLVAFYSTL